MRKINWSFLAIIVAMLYFDMWLVLYVLAPLLDHIADLFVKRMQ